MLTFISDLEILKYKSIFIRGLKSWKTLVIKPQVILTASLGL